MKRQVLKIMTLAALSPAVMAQTSAPKMTTPVQTSTVAEKSLFRQIKDSAFDMALNMETDTKRNAENKVDGFAQTNRLLSSYKLTANDKMSLDLRSTHNKLNNTDTVNSVERSALKYARKGLMTQAAQGVDLSASAEYRYLPNSVARNAKNRYSHVRVGTTAARSSGNFAADVGLFYAFNQTKDKDSAPNRAASNWYMPLSQSYNLTDKLKTSLTEELFYSNTASSVQETGSLDLTAEAGYQFTDDFYIGLSAAGTPVSRTDGTEAKGWGKQLTYGVNFDITVF